MCLDFYRAFKKIVSLKKNKNLNISIDKSIYRSEMRKYRKLPFFHAYRNNKLLKKKKKAYLSTLYSLKFEN